MRALRLHAWHGWAQHHTVGGSPLLSEETRECLKPPLATIGAYLQKNTRNSTISSTIHKSRAQKKTRHSTISSTIHKSRAQIWEFGGLGGLCRRGSCTPHDIRAYWSVRVYCGFVGSPPSLSLWCRGTVPQGSIWLYDVYMESKSCDMVAPCFRVRAKWLAPKYQVETPNP